MLPRRKGLVEITSDHQFSVAYLGHRKSSVDVGREGSLEAVSAMWEDVIRNSNAQGRSIVQSLPRVAVSINTTGISTQDRLTANKFDIEYISYCCADRQHPSTFAWIYNTRSPQQSKDSDMGDWSSECHAVVCGDVYEARRMVTLLSDAFDVAHQHLKYELKQRTITVVANLTPVGTAVVHTGRP